jgi:HEAT repeat protein
MRLFSFWVVGLAVAFLFLQVGSSRCQPKATTPQEPVYEGKTLSAWVAILKDQKTDEFVRAAAARALRNFGKPAVAPLAEVMKDDSVILRCAAAETLGKMGVEAKTAVPALVGIVKDPKVNSHVRFWTIRALGAMGAEAEPAVPALLASLRDRESWIAIAAAQALGKIGPAASKEAIPLLAEALKSPCTELREMASALLAEYGSEAKAAVPALVDAMKDHDGKVRLGALAALEKIGPEAKAAVPALVNALKDRDEKFRDAAIGALATAATIQGLTELLKDKVPAIRSGAARALRRIGPKAKEAVPALTELLKDKDRESQTAAASALLEIGPEAQATAIRFWVERLKDKDPRTASEGWFDLSRVGSAAMPVCLELLKDKDPAMRSLGGQCLLVISVGLENSSPKKKESVPTLIALLKDKEPEARGWAAICLAIVGPAAKDAVPTLLPLLQDNREIESPAAFFNGGNVKVKISQVAAEALKAIDPEAAKEAGVK